MLKHGTVEQEDTHVTTVPAPCAGFGARVEVVPLSGVFGQRWAACGAAAVRDSHDAGISAIQAIRIQRKNASGGRISGPFGGVRF